MLDALLKRPVLLGCRAGRANAQLGGEWDWDSQRESESGKRFGSIRSRTTL